MQKVNKIWGLNTAKKVLVLAATVMLTATPLTAMAKVTLEDLESPLTLQLTTPIDGKTVEEGASFEAVVPEDHEYEEKILPAGTVFSGNITKRHSSTHVSNPGYVRLTVTKATFPNGQTITFDGTELKESDKIYGEDANNIKKSLKTMTPFAIVSLATQLPIKLFTNMAAYPFTYMAKASLALGREFYLKTHPTWKPEHRVANSLLIGSGIPGMLFILSKRKEPQLAEGENVQISLDEKVMSQFFEAI